MTAKFKGTVKRIDASVISKRGTNRDIVRPYFSVSWYDDKGILRSERGDTRREAIKRARMAGVDVLNEKEDMSELPEAELKKIKTNVSKGAKDTNQRWANALELVHKAYEVAAVQRPDITMEKAWKQYEEVIKHAVQELAKARGMDDEWRMTSSSLRENVEPEEIEFSLETTVDGLPVNVVKKAKSIEELIRPFFDHNVTGHDIEIRHRSLNNVCLYFCKDGKRTGDKVTIRKR